MADALVLHASGILDVSSFLAALFAAFLRFQQTFIIIPDSFLPGLIFHALLIVLADHLQSPVCAVDIDVFFRKHVKFLLPLCIDKFRPQFQVCASFLQAVRKLGQLYNVEFHLVRVKEVSGIFPDMKAGIEFCLVPKEDKVQDADAHTLLEYAVALPGPDLLREHLGQVEQGAVSPYRQSFVWKDIQVP